MAEDADPTLDPRQANFRRRGGFLCIFLNAAIGGAVLIRPGDIGTNTASIIEWIVLANAAGLLAAFGSKAVEQILIARTGGTKP